MSVGLLVGWSVDWSVGFDTTLKKVLCASPKHIPDCRSVFFINKDCEDICPVGEFLK